MLQKKINKENREIIVGDVLNSNLPDSSVKKVYGEAILTMQTNNKKFGIVREAHRILEKGGLYGIHELCLKPNNLDEETKNKIQRELSRVIRVNARPLTESQWDYLLGKEGFQVKKVMTMPMQLLEFKRVISDEGFLRSIKIVLNILRNSKARKRIKAMRSVFRKHVDQINAIVIIAEKR